MIIGLVEKDLPQIISMVEGFEENLGDRYRSVDALADYFEKYGCRGEKAVEEGSGRLVGFIIYYMGYWWPLDRKIFHSSRSIGFISDIIVYPDSWRRGIGTALVRSAEEDLISMGADKITLYTGLGNVRAQGFFSKLGYSVSGQSASSVGYEKEIVRRQ